MKLYLKQKLLSLTDSYKVMDENENIIYQVKSKLLKLTAEMNIMNANDDIVYTIKRKMTFFRPKYEIRKDGEVIATLVNKKLLAKKWELETSERSLSMKGSLFAYNLEIFEGEKEIAKINKKVVALTDCYEIDVFDDKDVDLVVALVIAVDNAYHNE